MQEGTSGLELLVILEDRYDKMSPDTQGWLIQRGQNMGAESYSRPVPGVQLSQNVRPGYPADTTLRRGWSGGRWSIYVQLCSVIIALSACATKQASDPGPPLVPVRGAVGHDSVEGEDNPLLGAPRAGVRGVTYEPDAGEDKDPLLEVRFMAERLGEQVSLPQHGSALYSKDHFWFVVTLPTAAYLYVLLVSPADEVVQLYPPTGEERQRNGLLRVPVRGRLRLDQRTGEERVLLVASREPLGTIKSAQDLLGFFPASRNEGPAPASSSQGHRSIEIESDYQVREKVSRPPRAKGNAKTIAVLRTYSPNLDRSARGGRTRGVLYEIEYEGDEYEIQGIADEDGLVVIPITFAHRARPAL